MGIVPSGGTDGNTTGKAGAALGSGGSGGGGFPSNVEWNICRASFQDIQPRAQGGKGCFCDMTGVRPIDLVVQGLDSCRKRRDIAAYFLRKRRDVLASDLFVQGFYSLRERRDFLRKRCDVVAYLGDSAGFPCQKF